MIKSSLIKDNLLFTITYTAEETTQYERYKDVFEQILKTVEFVESEKSYRTFSQGGNETVKLYEDGTKK